jgi:hypothetical protein
MKLTAANKSFENVAKLVYFVMTGRYQDYAYIYEELKIRLCPGNSMLLWSSEYWCYMNTDLCIVTRHNSTNFDFDFILLYLT